jgi:hypothetical protein
VFQRKTKSPIELRVGLACLIAYSRCAKIVLLPSSIFIFPQDQEQVKNTITTRCTKYAPDKKYFYFQKIKSEPEYLFLYP